MIRPFLKWPGGKFRLLDRILPHCSAVPTRFVEVFAGSCAVFLNVPAREALINDVNADLIGLYACLQEEGEAFVRFMQGFFTQENNTRENYLYLRSAFNASRDRRVRAALFLYLNRHGYNGLVRYNSRGLFNVPFGRYKAPSFPTGALEDFLDKLAVTKTRFVCQDFRTVFAGLEPGDVVYCDPPYVPLSRTASFTTYSGTAFTASDQEELALLAEKACTEQGATVIVSNHDTPHIRTLYQGARIISFDVQRFISCKERKRAPELLAVFRP